MNELTDDVVAYGPEHAWVAVACYGARSVVSEAADRSTGLAQTILRYCALAAPWSLALALAGFGVVPFGNALAIAGVVTTRWSHK
jgi:hypothetical protein